MDMDVNINIIMILFEIERWDTDRSTSKEED